MRRKDALLISFFCGTITIIIFMFLALLCIPDSTLDHHINGEINDSAMELFSQMYTFRFLFMLIFILAASGFVIRIIKDYKINYMYIFELDP